MKTIVIFIAWAALFVVPLRAQSIINKLGTGGVFTIKDATKDFFTLSQSTGYIGIGTTTPNNLLQVANLVNFDPRSLSTALGAYALFSNSNTGFYNTATGYEALYSNTTGSFNIATGRRALYSNSTGTSNIAIGTDALNSNRESYNVGIGNDALEFTTGARYNVAVGHDAGDSHNNGYNNVFVGANTDVNQDNLFNVIAVGQGTIVTASSTARFGNLATVSYGGWANWSNVSDGRFKKNVRENVPGLEFILKLRPVTYNFDATGMETFLHKNDRFDPVAERKTVSIAESEVENRALQEKEHISQTGFVAQEVEAVAQDLGYDFSGVDKPKNENDYYGLRYAEFVVPLVKAVQELNKKQELQIAQLKAENADIKERLVKLERMQERLMSEHARHQTNETSTANLSSNQR